MTYQDRIELKENVWALNHDEVTCPYRGGWRFQISIPEKLGWEFANAKRVSPLKWACIELVQERLRDDELNLEAILVIGEWGRVTHVVVREKK